MEQYLVLSRENQAPGVVKPKIGGNVNFKIKSQCMRELREDTFSGNKGEDAHDHIDWVLGIVGLFNIPEVSKDAVILRVFSFTLTGFAKRWVDRLAPETINTWDLLKKAFTQRPGSCIMTYSQGPIPGMRPAEALTAIQTIADHSQKWHDGTTSRNIGSNSSMDGLAALVNKLDNLGRDMKRIKESVHAIQVGCQICKAPHLDNNGGKFRVGPPGYYTKIDNHPSYGKKRQSLEEVLAKHQEESAQRSTEIELTKEIRSDKTLDSSSEQLKTVTVDQETSGLNKLHGVSVISDPESDTTEVLQHQLPHKELNPGNFTLPCKIGKFNFCAMADLGASINVMPRSIFEHLHHTNLRKTCMLCEMADMSKKAPLGIVENINNQIDYEESGNWDNRSPNLDDREPKKWKIKLDKNVPRAHFCSPIKQNIKEQTKMWPSCDPDKTMCDGRVEICGVSKTGNLSQTDALIWDSRYDEWCDISPSFEASSQESNKPRPRDYTFREWTLIKVGHTDISEPVKKALLKLSLIDCFQGNSACENNPTHRSFDDYKWEFNLEIDKLAGEYELGIGKKGHILDHVWEYCNQVHNKNYEWHNYEFENEECKEIGIEDKEYHPPEVQVETFEVKRYSFKGG
ncbi:hypothetical protein Tco_0278509 [Tanacetum coccineum]